MIRSISMAHAQARARSLYIRRGARNAAFLHGMAFVQRLSTLPLRATCRGMAMSREVELTGKSTSYMQARPGRPGCAAQGAVALAARLRLRSTAKRYTMLANACVAKPKNSGMIRIT